MPVSICCDNGPELIAGTFCRERGIEIRHIEPGKPDQNAFIERCNRSYREDVLDAYLFESIAEVQTLSDEWLRDDNEERPHDVLGSVPPAQYLTRPTTPAESSFEVCP